MKPPPPDHTTPQERLFEALRAGAGFEGVREDPAELKEHRRAVRARVRAYPEPIELAHLALKLAPELCGQGKAGWIQALRNAREYYDDAVEAATMVTDRDRQDLRLKQQRKQVAELMSKAEERGYLRFQPDGSGDDTFREELRKQSFAGFDRADGYWYRWGKQHGEPDPEEPSALRVSALLLEKAILSKKLKLSQAKTKRKRSEREPDASGHE